MTSVLAAQRKILDAANLGAATAAAAAIKPADNRFRKILIESQVLGASVGSAYVEIGNTKVICSINGPREQNNVDAYEGNVNVTISGMESSTKYAIQSALCSVVCLKKIARAEVDVELSVLADDGGALAATAMAASVALVAANIECFDVVLACHFLAYDDGTYVLDPTATRAAEIRRAAAPRRVAASHAVDAIGEASEANAPSDDDADEDMEDLSALPGLAPETTSGIARTANSDGSSATKTPSRVADVTIGIAPSLGQVVLVDVCRGALSKSVLNKAIRFGFDKCLEIYPLMSKNLHDHAGKSYF